jgi:MFS family permease
MLFLGRIIDGTSGGNIATAQACIADVTKPEERSKAMGIIGAAFGLGFIMGPAIGGILGAIRPQIGHVYGYRLEPSADGDGTLVTSFYDWSDIDPEWRKANIFPVVPERALRATLGILDRTVRRGYPRG